MVEHYDSEAKEKYSSSDVISRIEKAFGLEGLTGEVKKEGIQNAIYKLYREDMRDY